MRRILTVLALGVVLSSGCGANPGSPSGPLPVTTTLQVGQQARVSGLTVRFAGVSADSRCPSNSNCVVAGDATLQFDLSANQRAARYELLVARPDKRRASHEGFAIEVQTLAPYPAGGPAIRQDEYRATVTISR